MLFLLPKHVSGINIPIIRSKIIEYFPLLGGHTWKFAWVVLHWASWSEDYSEDVAGLIRPHPPSILLMMGILVPETC
jgi:hypothetical protein